MLQLSQFRTFFPFYIFLSSTSNFKNRQPQLIPIPLLHYILTHAFLTLFMFSIVINLFQFTFRLGPYARQLTIHEALECLPPALDKPKSKTLSSLSLESYCGVPVHPYSFFYSYYLQLFLSPEDIPFYVDSEDDVAPTYQTYPPPTWIQHLSNPLEPPLMLDPSRIPAPTDESTFRTSLFRLDLSQSPHLLSLLTCHLRQGTPVYFKGFEYEEGHHIVEWCQLVEDDRAYLKVVGWRRDRTRYPYQDPLYPSFILVIPASLSQVETPPSLLPDKTLPDPLF